MEYQLLPSYWVLGRLPKTTQEENWGEEVNRDWQMIVKSGFIEPRGRNLGWLQNLSPVSEAVFLSYGKPYELLVPPHDLVPVLTFDTEVLIEQGAVTSRNLDGGLWWGLDEIADSLLEEIADGTGIFESMDLADLFHEHLTEGASLHASVKEPFQVFCGEFKKQAEQYVDEQVLSGTDALQFLQSVAKKDIDDCDIEINYFGKLPLKLATDIKVPQRFARQLKT